MDASLFKRLEAVDAFRWRLPRHGRMLTDVVFMGSVDIVAALDDTAFRQAANVACLPGVVQPVCVMPDAHMGYGFPIGGVAAFDPDHGGVVSAGGVGYDIACGVRTLLTGLDAGEVLPVLDNLADRLFAAIPSGVGRGGDLVLGDKAMEAMLEGGAVWAVKQGYGERADLERIEDGGRAPGADPGQVSSRAKERQRAETGTLGSGNHYLEVQRVADILDAGTAGAWGLRRDDVLVSIHCGSRGLGHQVATDYLEQMRAQAPRHGLDLPDPELACAPIDSQLGRDYLSAMRAAANCALANRQVLSHLTRQVFAEFFPTARLRPLYDVSHNTCKQESLTLNGRQARLFVHRKGATRAWGPSHPELPVWLRGVGQPMPVGGSMGSASYILAGTDASLERSFGSSCHGAGRALSRSQALKRFKGREVLEGLASRGVALRARGYKGVAEEAPGAYKDIEAVVRSAAGAGLATPVARLIPMACVKG